MKYQVFSSSDEVFYSGDGSGNNQLEIINEYIRESQSTDFTGRWALLVEWSDVHPYDHQYFVNFPFFFQGETADFLSSVSQYCVNVIPFIIHSCTDKHIPSYHHHRCLYNIRYLHIQMW